MGANRLTATVYWVAIGVFLAGVAVLFVEAALGVSHIPGEMVLVAAWALAALGAVLDILRHRRHPSPE